MVRLLRICFILLFSVILVACVQAPGSFCDGSCTDSDITTSVQVKINVDRCMSDQYIHVSTYERVVTLTGHVSNPTQKKIATRMAKSVPGVKRVMNNLRVLKRD